MYQKIANYIGSKPFFIWLVGLLILQAAWLALSGRYPMAFDEDFHFGIIKLYAHHLSPFWHQQPLNADAYGAVTRDPSYLYQYLMSFPYRLIAILTHSQTIQIIILRFINIALFASALPLYRRLLLKTGASSAIVNLVLACFILIPVVPQLAAQINYDNLFIPLVAWALIMTLNISQELTQDKRVNIKTLAYLITLGLFTSLVKYAFLPLFVAILVFIAFQLLRQLGYKKKLWLAFKNGITVLNKRTMLIVIFGLILGVSMFFERYGLNLLRYHTLIPNCTQVLNIQHCSAYGPWSRDYVLAATKGNNLHGAGWYSVKWLHDMWLRLFFAVDGPATNFETRGPLILPAVAAVIIASFGLVATIFSWHKIIRYYHTKTILLFLFAAGFYILALWLDEFKAYLHTGQPVAINSRYLLPVLIPVMLLLALGLNVLLKQHLKLRLIIAGLTLLSFMWGGGALTYILRSRDAWLWPNNTVRHINFDVRSTFGPFIPGDGNPLDYL